MWCLCGMVGMYWWLCVNLVLFVILCIGICGGIDVYGWWLLVVGVFGYVWCVVVELLFVLVMIYLEYLFVVCIELFGVIFDVFDVLIVFEVVVFVCVLLLCLCCNGMC